MFRKPPKSARYKNIWAANGDIPTKVAICIGSLSTLQFDIYNVSPFRIVYAGVITVSLFFQQR